MVNVVVKMHRVTMFSRLIVDSMSTVELLVWDRLATLTFGLLGLLFVVLFVVIRVRMVNSIDTVVDVFNVVVR